MQIVKLMDVFMPDNCFGICSAEVCHCSETAKECRMLHSKSVRTHINPAMHVGE